MTSPIEPVDRYETPEEIAAHIDSLMAEAEAMLAGPVSARVPEKLGELRLRFSEAQAAFVELYGTTRRKLIAAAKSADDTIREHPYHSLAIALAFGVLLGVNLRRRGDER